MHWKLSWQRALGVRRSFGRQLKTKSAGFQRFESIRNFSNPNRVSFFTWISKKFSWPVPLWLRWNPKIPANPNRVRLFQSSWFQNPPIKPWLLGSSDCTVISTTPRPADPQQQDPLQCSINGRPLLSQHPATKRTWRIKLNPWKRRKLKEAWAIHQESRRITILWNDWRGLKRNRDVLLYD